MTKLFNSFASELEKLGSGFLLNAGMNAFSAVSAVKEGKGKMKDVFKTPSFGQTPLSHWSEYGFGRGKIYQPTKKFFRTRLPI